MTVGPKRVEDLLSKDLWGSVVEFLPVVDSCTFKGVARGEGWEGTLHFRVLTAPGDGGTCRVWKTPTASQFEWEFTGLPTARALHFRPVKDFALTNDGHWLVALCEDKKVYVFDLRTGSQVPFVSDLTAKLNHLDRQAVVMDRRLADAAEEEKETIRICRKKITELQMMLNVMKTIDIVKAVAISQPDGRRQCRNQISILRDFISMFGSSVSCVLEVVIILVEAKKFYDFFWIFSHFYFFLIFWFSDFFFSFNFFSK